MGVFSGTKHSLNTVSQPELDSDSKIIWAKIKNCHTRPLNAYVCSYNKPKENDESSLEGLRFSLSKITHSSLIWALGDFSLPRIDWDKDQIKESCYYKSTHQTFFDIIHDFGLEQIIKEPTRDKLTNHPSLVQA